jgi:hypothetical protein
MAKSPVHWLAFGIDIPKAYSKISAMVNPDRFNQAQKTRRAIESARFKEAHQLWL